MDDDDDGDHEVSEDPSAFEEKFRSCRPETERHFPEYLCAHVLMWKHAQLILKYKCTQTATEGNQLIWALPATVRDHFSVWIAISNFGGLRRSQEPSSALLAMLWQWQRSWPAPAAATTPWPWSLMPDHSFSWSKGCQEGLWGWWAVWKVLLSAPHKATYQRQEVGRGRVTVQTGIQD